MPSRRAWGVEDPIWVEDRHGTGLPYSKGLMAASIMATGILPGRAYELAAHIEEQLRAQGMRRVAADVLVDRAYDVLSKEEGTGVADRYLAWRRAKRSARPIVVLIGGATGVGKSTVATKLAARLDLPRVIPTDAVRQVMRSLLDDKTAPEIHRSSFEGNDLVDGFLHQARTVGSGVISLVERTFVEKTDLIIEGVHLVPGLLADPRIQRLQAEAVIVQVLLAVNDTGVHRSHFLHRLDNEHGRSPARYLNNLEQIRQVQRHLRELAARYGVPVVEASELDRAIQSVIELVVADVTASESLEAEAG